MRLHAASTVGDEDEDSVEGGGEDSDEEDFRGEEGAHPGGDHCEEFGVADSKTFGVAELEVDPADEEDERMVSALSIR